MLEALAHYSPTTSGVRSAPAYPYGELRSGMALDKDVTSKDGNLLIFKQGTVLTETWIERLENFAKARGAQELMDVRIPPAHREVGHAGGARLWALPKPRSQKHADAEPSGHSGARYPQSGAAAAHSDIMIVDDNPPT